MIVIILLDFSYSPITSHSQVSATSGIRPLGVTPVNEQQIKRQALEAFDTPGQCFYVR